MNMLIQKYHLSGVQNPSVNHFDQSVKIRIMYQCNICKMRLKAPSRVLFPTVDTAHLTNSQPIWKPTTLPFIYTDVHQCDETVCKLKRFKYP